MDYSKRQEELDVIKWVDSETKNYDTCGEYEYCSNCNKNEAYPCAYAYEKYFSAYKAAAKLTTKISSPKTIKTTAKKTETKKSTSCKSKTTTKKTSTTKKSTKTTAKAY